MKVLVAIDSLKGCLSSLEANEAVRDGILCRWPDAEVFTVPVSDGGEGFVDAVHEAVGGALIETEVYDPLMRPVCACYLLSDTVSPAHISSEKGGMTAYIEMAQASGLCLLPADERNPLITTSYGTGQLIADAVQRGVLEIVVGLGGSATSDCGRGMLQALEGTDLQGIRFVIATDVDNLLLGPRGAAHVFARQKGATEAMLDVLEQRAVAFVSENRRIQGRDCSQLPGAGAAGGVGYALMQFFGAERRSGAELILEAARFDTLLSEADLVVTGEGSADRQTLMGKLPSVILAKAKHYRKPVVLVAGRITDAETLLSAGFAQVFCINPPESPLAECMKSDVAWQRLHEVAKYF